MSNQTTHTPTNSNKFVYLPTTTAFVAFVQVQGKRLSSSVAIFDSADTLRSLCNIIIDIVRVMILVSMRKLKAFTSLNARKRTMEKIEQSAPVPEGVALSLFRSARPDPSFLVCTFILFFCLSEAQVMC
jgi:hypothetical protein